LAEIHGPAKGVTSCRRSIRPFEHRLSGIGKGKAARGTSPHRNLRKPRAQRAAEAKIRHEVDEDRQKHVALETHWRFMRKQNGT
jgi:hypothetical protein